MARKSVKTEDVEDGVILSEEDEKQAVRDRIRKEIASTFGENLIVKGSDIVDRPQQIIPISPRLDSITGGGIPEGSWVIMSGTYKGGKTTTALHFAANCQKPEFGGRNVYYLNVEARLKKRDLLGMAHLNPDRFDVIESTEDKILSSQDFLSIGERILMNDRKAIMIIDSISSLCEQRELAGGIGTETRGGGAKLIGQFTKQMASVVPVKNHIIIAILHVRDNTSGFGLPWFESGGKAIQFQSDIKLRVEKFEKWGAKENEPPFGQIVHWQCHWSALGTPNRKTTSYLRYGYGIDETFELIEDAKEVGLISGDNWLTCDFMKNHLDILGVDKWDEKTLKDANVTVKVQGAPKLRTFLIERPDWLVALKADLEDFN